MYRATLVVIVSMVSIACSSSSRLLPESDAIQDRCYGHLYGEEGLPVDYAEAHRWCRQSAELGTASGQTLYAQLFYFGLGTPQSYSTAADWYRKAAAQGHRHAQFMMGLLYLEGEGVERDRDEAIRWLEKAAAQDYEKAVSRLKQVRPDSSQDAPRRPTRRCS